MKVFGNKDFDTRPDWMSTDIKESERARKKYEAMARAAADAEVARISSVAKHLDKDDLDDVWQEAYERVLKQEMDEFEAALAACEDEEDDQRRLGEYFADRLVEQSTEYFADKAQEQAAEYFADRTRKQDALRRLGLIPIDPNHVCHDCQSKPCRCAEFSGKALLEAALMDDLIRIEEDYEDSLDNTCGTCHNWPCVCGTAPDGF